MPKLPERPREPKASRSKVWQAVERIVQSGRRPTVEGVREVLGGGSPNAVTAYINEWYGELGARLAEAQAPISGIPPEARSLLSELWVVAARAHPEGDTGNSAVERVRASEHASLVAEVKSYDVLSKELRRERAALEQSLADARALLRRREAELEALHLESQNFRESLTHAALERDVLAERLRLRPPPDPEHGSARRSTARRRRKRAAVPPRSRPKKPIAPPRAGRKANPVPKPRRSKRARASRAGDSRTAKVRRKRRAT